ncbi:MAG: hypothetical protein JO257_08455 [Deltaproteobacteria bacterium]|nr:hypothetical protein [Deltaproteobacteria bacterium]
MAKLSSAAWIAHDVGLATAIGGTLFGREALHPALREGIADPDERDRVADAAWRKFSWVNLAGHIAMASTWFAGRTMLSGREVDRTSRPLTVAKDALIVASLATGAASVVIGRILGAKVRNDEQPTMQDREQVETLRRAVGAVGLVNLAANIGILGVTAALAMQAAKSPKFSFWSRLLP